MCASREPARIARSSSFAGGDVRVRRGSGRGPFSHPAWSRSEEDGLPDRLRCGSGAPGAINILTRSISEIIRDLASLIEIPPEDVATGRTYATFTADEVDLKRVRIRARVDVFPPILQDSYVTAYYRGRWFWIEDTDLRSKQVFSFVIELLQLAQRTTAPSLPVVTIPSG